MSPRLTLVSTKYHLGISGPVTEDLCNRFILIFPQSAVFYTTMEEFVNQEDCILLIQFMNENRDGYV